MLQKVKRSLPAVAVVLLAAVLLCAMSLLSHAEAEVTPRANPAPVTFSAVDGVETGEDEGYARLLDGRKSEGRKNVDYTKWCVSMGDDGVYVVIKASEAIKVSGYHLVTGNDTADNSGRNPKDWSLSASNDYDEATKSGTWTTLASVAGDTTLPAENFADRAFTVAEPDAGYTAYQYYKFHFTAVQGSGTGGSLLQLCEISLTYTRTGFHVTAIDGTAGNTAVENCENLFDGKKTDDNFSKWCVLPNAETSAYVIFRTSEPIVLNGYALVTGNDNASYTGRNPKDWTLYGSANYDETSGEGTWSPLHTVTNDTQLTDVNYSSAVWSLADNHTLYRYYKLEITANKGGNVLQLSEMELSFADCTHNWVEGTPTAATCTEPPYKNYTCSLCQATKREVNGVAIQHDWEETSRDAATCLTQEEIHETCNNCSETRTRNGVAALGHDWKETGAVGATCTAWAYVDVVCERCNATEHRLGAPAKGHIFGADGICLRCALPPSATDTAGAFTVTGGTQGTDYTYQDGILTILTDTALTIANTDPTVAAKDRIYIAKDVSARITLAGVNINVGITTTNAYHIDAEYQLCALEIAKDSSGDVTITLADGSTNFLMSGAFRAGIQKMGANGSLLINGKGKLEVWGGARAPGIGTGGYYNGNVTYTQEELVVANITIADCTIVAGGSRINVQNDDGSYKDACVYSSGTFAVPAPAIGVGYLHGSQNCSEIVIPGHITLLNANVTAYSVASSGIGVASRGQMTDVTIVGGSFKWIQDVSGVATPAAVGGERDARNDPVNAAGDRLYLLVIDNSEGERILIDGAYIRLVAHAENDKKVYAWLTGEAHTVQVGDSIYQYSFNEANVGTWQSVFSAGADDPATASAAVPAFTVESASDSLAVTSGVDYTYEGGVLTILSGTPMIISSNGLPTTDVIVIASADPVRLTLRNIHIDVSLTEGAAALSIAATSGDVTLLIESDVTLKSGKGRAGLEKSSSARLTIAGSGSLLAAGGENGAGIGGGNAQGGSKIDIGGASIVAVGGKYAAGVGGGNGGVGEDINVTGGVLTANGGLAAAGIGGGKGSHCANITISGGTVLAIGSTVDCTVQEACDGIGCGAEPDTTADNITISGGSVRVASYQYGHLTDLTCIGAYLCQVLPNPSAAAVRIDGIAYAPVSSAALDDTNLYIWYTEGAKKTVTIGEVSRVWHCSAGEFIECKATGDWVVEADSHYHTCGAYDCDTKHDLADHAYTEETVSDTYLCTPASCTAPATYYHSCICGKKGTTTFSSGAALGHEHTGTYREVTGEAEHEEYCSRCEAYVEPTAHTYDRVVREARYLRRAASCTEPASYYKSCVCGAHTTAEWQDDTNALGHEVNTALGLQKDASGHWYACTRCDEKLLADGTAGSAAHSYYSACSTTCGTCGYDRSASMTADHDPAEAWSHDGTSHWHTCGREIDAAGATCTAKLDLAAHTFEDGRYKTIDGRHYPLCDTCDYYDAARGADCDSTWAYDTAEHWHECSVCGSLRDTKLTHTFDNACDTTCNDTCGYTRETRHNYDETRWVTDETKHWHACTICGDPKDEADHDFNKIYSDDEHWEKCLCGKIRNKEAHTYADDKDTTCEGCKYVRKLKVTSIRLGMDGYAVGERITSLTVTFDESNEGVYWDDGAMYYNQFQDRWYWWIVTDFDMYMTATYGYNGYYVDHDDTGYFQPMQNYWLVVELTPTASYTFDYLRCGDITLDGVGSACYIIDYFVPYSSSQRGYMQAFFRLPLLTGESKVEEMPKLDFTLAGYEVGELVTDITIDLDEDCVRPADMELDFCVDGNFIYRYDDITEIEQGSYYDLDVVLYAPDGYTFYGFTADMINIEGLGSPMHLEVSAGGGSIYFWYRLPNLDPTHVHSRSDWACDYDLGTHYRWCWDCMELLDDEPHVYDGPYDDLCNVCGYMRDLIVSDLTLVLDGYETDGDVGDASISFAASTYGYDMHMLRYFFAEAYEDGLSSTSILGAGDRFLPDREYWVIVTTATDRDHYFMMKENFFSSDAVIEGVGEAAMVLQTNGGTLIAYFKLGTLTGESEYDYGFPHANYTVDGYAAGNAYQDLVFTPAAGHAGLESISFALRENGVDVSAANGTLDPTKNYEILVAVTFEQGYTIYDLPSTALTLTGSAELLHYVTNPATRQAIFTFRMPTLDRNHVHDYKNEGCDDASHWMACACGEKKDVESHDFGSPTGLTCSDCGYDRILPVTDVALTLGGYTYGSTLDSLTIVPADGCGVTVEAGYANGYIISTFIYGIIYPDEASYKVFGDEVDYYLMLQIEAMPNYTLDTLSIARIQLSGVGAPLMVETRDATTLVVIYRLPRLEVPHMHDGLAWIDEISATCRADGTLGHSHCPLCEKDFDEEGNELTDLKIASTAEAHDHGAWIDEVAATCTEAGIVGHYHCASCGGDLDADGNLIESLALPIDPDAHTRGAWIDEVPATTESEGTRGHSDCLACGKHFGADGQEIAETTIERLAAYVIRVTGGTIGDGTTATAVEGERVTVRADAPAEGMVFLGWYDEDGALLTQDATYSFLAASDLSLHAICEEEQKSLPSGAVAGITVGSVLVAEVAGFSLFWFVIRKKSLGALLGLFRKP